MVSAAMVLTATTGTQVDPRLLNNWLNQTIINNQIGYDEGNGPRWSVIAQYPNSKIQKATAEESYINQDSDKLIDAALDTCDMVILLVKSNSTYTILKHHYVVIASGRNGNYKIYDPWIFPDEGDKITQIDNWRTRYQSIMSYRIINLVK